MPPVEPDLVERIRRDKARRQSQVPAHCDRPTLALVLHSFNRVSNIDHLIAGLRYRGDHELIVCEDGSLDGSHEKWGRHPSLLQAVYDAVRRQESAQHCKRPSIFGRHVLGDDSFNGSPADPRMARVFF